jgi:hypothetical protein
VFSTFVLGPVGLAGVAGLVYPFGLGVAMWVVVAAVALAKGSQLQCQALRTRVAGRPVEPW